MGRKSIPEASSNFEERLAALEVSTRAAVACLNELIERVETTVMEMPAKSPTDLSEDTVIQLDTPQRYPRPDRQTETSKDGTYRFGPDGRYYWIPTARPLNPDETEKLIRLQSGQAVKIPRSGLSNGKPEMNGQRKPAISNGKASEIKPRRGILKRDMVRDIALDFMDSEDGAEIKISPNLPAPLLGYILDGSSIPAEMLKDTSAIRRVLNALAGNAALEQVETAERFCKLQEFIATQAAAGNGHSNGHRKGSNGKSQTYVWSAADSRMLCNYVEPETFFPEKGGSSREAKGICALCVLKDMCLEQALEDGERFGVWGGLSVKQRKEVITARSNGKPESEIKKLIAKLRGISDNEEDSEEELAQPQVAQSANPRLQVV